MVVSQMLKYKVFGCDLYHIINWFWIYCFIGWIWESSYVSIKNHKLVNRGFVTGPVLTLYGSGAVIIYLLLQPFSSNVLVLYFGGTLLATTLEYITGVLMEWLFHANWWDYSNQRFQFQGKICLSSSIAWGFLTLAIFYIFHPLVSFLVSLYPRAVGETAIFVITMVYCVDFGMSVFAASHMREHLEERKARFFAYLERFDDVEFESWEIWKERWGEHREQHLERFTRFLDTYVKDKVSLDWITRRYMNAYPNLELSSVRKKLQKNKEKKKLEKQEKEK